ncbi:hypothetical protein [Senegalia massiliensis]|uniref:Uncharacterized protein n=1 Tax=Senegalia massiliensis TaxID=1720316 RepID=A0A845QXF7_9CLOT|nr:hypothetical protein [Senegalia massiliensis]NBI05832.1 hypothetical protein [Senegalia massiliensis]
MNKNYRNEVKMIRNIKRYFPENQQLTLSKVEDVFDILDKINRVRLNKYDGLIEAKVDLPSIDRIEMILIEIGEYSGGKSKELVSKLVNTKKNIYKTKDNIKAHNNSFRDQNSDKLESAISFMNCFKPILKEDMNNKIIKIEKVINLLTTSKE